MKFKRVNKVTFQGNFPKNLILRQRFGMKLIDVLHSGKKLINFD